MQSAIVHLGKNQKVTVRELTVKEIKELFDMPEEVSPIDRLTFLLNKISSGTLKNEELLRFSPSELDGLVESMLKVNKSFFAQAERVGMMAVGEGLEKMICSVSMTALLS